MLFVPGRANEWFHATCDAVAHRAQAGVKLRPTRHAHRHTRIRVAERHAFRRQPVDRRRLEIPPAEQRQIGIGRVVRNDQQDVRRRCRRGRGRQRHGRHACDSFKTPARVHALFLLGRSPGSARHRY